jgi:hypothetical protein
MPEFTPKAVRVPGCIPTEMRQMAERLAETQNRAVAGDTINIDVTSVGGSTIQEITNIANHTDAVPPPTAMFLHEDTLAADLNSGATVSLSGKTLNGKYIRSGYKLPSGTLVGCLPNGTDYSIIVANACEVLQ